MPEPGEPCPSIPWEKGGASQARRRWSTFLGTLGLRITWQRYTRRGMENPLGTKGLQCLAAGETCSFPGSERK